MTRDYYGTKRVTAWSQERDGAPGYAVKYADGYVSWSPKEVFEASYQPLDGLSFGHAIVALKAGKRVARRGWNGKAMWLKLTPGSTIPAPAARPGSAAADIVDERGTFDRDIEILPHIDMRTADGSLLCGWLASQTDMLADDWEILGER